MENKIINLYLSNMVGAVYKILPMYDNNDIKLSQYIDSLCIQLLGGLETFDELKICSKYLTVINIIQYFRTHEFDKKTCKREVLKCTNILSKLSNE